MILINKLPNLVWAQLSQLSIEKECKKMKKKDEKKGWKRKMNKVDFEINLKLITDKSILI